MNTLRDLADSVEARADERAPWHSPLHDLRDGCMEPIDDRWRMRFDGRTYDVDTVTAALALLLDDPCPDCVARGGRWEWDSCIWKYESDSIVESALRWQKDRPSVGGREAVVSIERGTAMWIAIRPCQRCSRHLTDTDVSRPGSPARLVCEAMPRELVGRTLTSRWPGSTAARDALAVLADQFQAAGDPRGLWLALWLSWAECSGCEGEGGWTITGSLRMSCSTCHGLGTALGERVPAMVEALAGFQEAAE